MVWSEARRSYKQRVWPRGKPGRKDLKGVVMGIALKSRKLTEADVRYIRKVAALARWLRKNDPKRQHQRCYPKGFRVRLLEHFAHRGITIHAIKKVLYNQKWRNLKPVDIHSRNKPWRKVPTVKKGRLHV